MRAIAGLGRCRCRRRRRFPHPPPRVCSPGRGLGLQRGGGCGAGDRGRFPDAPRGAATPHAPDRGAGRAPLHPSPAPPRPDPRRPGPAAAVRNPVRALGWALCILPLRRGRAGGAGGAGREGPAARPLPGVPPDPSRPQRRPLFVVDPGGLWGARRGEPFGRGGRAWKTGCHAPRAASASVEKPGEDPAASLSCDSAVGPRWFPRGIAPGGARSRRRTPPRAGRCGVCAPSPRSSWAGGRVLLNKSENARSWKTGRQRPGEHCRGRSMQNDCFTGTTGWRKGRRRSIV